MRRIVLFPLVLSFLLVACTKVGSASSEGQIQTEVARQLTVLATPGTSSLAAPTKTQANPAATELPTVTPTDTPTVTPTATFTPSFTPPQDDPVLALGGATWRDDFHAPDALYTYADESYRFAYDGGMYIITGFKSGGGDAWVYGVDQLENFYLELTATVTACSGYDRYGLIVGVPYPANNPTFAVRVACNGQYSFGYYDSTVDNKFHFLINWSASPYILAGSNQTNRLGVKAQGTRIMLYMNGHFLAETDAPELGKGRFGVFAASPNTAGMEVRVTSLAYWLLP